MTLSPTPPASSDPTFSGDGTMRAGFWIRFGGTLIDAILLAIVSVILRSTVSSAAGSGLGALISALYFSILIGSSRGQTLGQRMVGIRVIDARHGGSIGYGRAFARWIVAIFSAIVFLLGYLWMLWDSEKQCWHDKAANDFVVPVSSFPFTS
jgi:uncharacterized RDD family membrane protein YckC